MVDAASSSFYNEQKNIITQKIKRENDFLYLSAITYEINGQTLPGA